MGEVALQRVAALSCSQHVPGLVHLVAQASSPDRRWRMGLLPLHSSVMFRIPHTYADGRGGRGVE